MSKVSDRRLASFLAAARRTTTALDLSVPPPGSSRKNERSVLSLGLPPEELLPQLRHRSIALTLAVDLNDFIWLLASRPFDAIVALPDHLGIHAVRMLKLEELDDSISAELHFMALHHNRSTPVFLLPLPEELECALVVAPPSVVHFFRLSEVPLHTAILNVDVRALLRDAPS